MRISLHLYKMAITLNEIISVLGQEYKVLGSRNAVVDKVTTVEGADGGSLVWTGKQPADIRSFLNNNAAPVFIMPFPEPEKLEVPTGKSLIFTSDSRLAAITILSRFFKKRPQWGRHPSAVIDAGADIDPETYIGPNTFVGKCRVGKGSILFGNNYLYDGVAVGRDVTIHAGAVIGADGFGYHPDENREWMKFEHLGGVEIGNGVEIGANTCIDRGTLGNTIIGDGTKIDNLVHVAHNVIIGRHCLIIAHAMIGGSCVIGDHAWVAPHAGLLQKVEVGPNATIGLGAIVLENVPPGETWAGVPARKIK